MTMMTLGIDTSNYATSLAVVDTHSREVVYSNKRMLPVTEGQLGLRQSEAVFAHVQSLPAMMAEMTRQVDVSRIDAVGVSEKPRPVDGSYMPCFTVGSGHGQTFSVAKSIPLYHTTHQQGHIAAALYGARQFWAPAKKRLVFHVSGGTTELLLTRTYQIEKLVGATQDLYAGQAVDRLGAKLGFSFPAGAALSTLAAECEERIPTKECVRGTNCHLSGLQNQCEKMLEEGKTSAYVAKYCLLFIADTLIAMIEAARQQEGNLPVLCAGGVLSSDTIRDHVMKSITGCTFVSPKLSSDNAVGVALIAAMEAQNA